MHVSENVPTPISKLEMAQRLAFLIVTNEDRENLIRIHDVIDEDVDGIIDEFYLHLRAFPDVRRFLNDGTQLKRLKAMQRVYLLSLGIEMDTDAYAHDRLHIGVVHERIGLPQKWYLGAYVKLFDLIEERLRARAATFDVPVSRLLTTLHRIMNFDIILTVDTYYDASTQRLETLLQQLTDARHELEIASRRDVLTGIHNRGFLFESLEMELHRSRRFGHPFTLLLLDVDHFKRVNDTWGHVFGDEVLRHVARLCREVLRPNDVLGRYGGEEFAAGIVETTMSSAYSVAERLRLKIGATPITFNGVETTVTVSIGLAEFDDAIARVEDLVTRADRGLYKAKESGRNRICVVEPV